MSGDPLDDVTRIDWGNTYDTTASTDMDSYSTATYTVTYSYSYYQSEEYLKKIKELIRKSIIKTMKDTWHEKRGEFKPLPKLRPSVQLRGVCLNGRGWA